MKSSCIAHPENEPLIKIHRWQVELCEGSTVAAALLSFFEYWHNIKLQMRGKAQRLNDIAQMHNDQRSQDETLLQFHSEEELILGVMIGKRDSVRKGICYLESKGFISIHKNPNPRYGFDKTRFFLFHPELINQWLSKRSYIDVDKSTWEVDKSTFDNHGGLSALSTETNVSNGSSINRPPMSINRPPSSENRPPSSENRPPSSENTSAITEITPEITSETTLSPTSLIQLPKEERERFESFVDKEWRKVKGVGVADFDLFLAQESKFKNWWRQFLASPDGKQAKKEAVATMRDWRSLPHYMEWLKNAYYRGYEWAHEVEAEREERCAFMDWARDVDAYEDLGLG